MLQDEYLNHSTPVKIRKSSQSVFSSLLDQAAPELTRSSVLIEEIQFAFPEREDSTKYKCGDTFWMGLISQIPKVEVSNIDRGKRYPR